MSEENRNRAGADPMALWRQWYETNAKLWSNMFAGSRSNYMDPYGFYRQWFKTLGNTREQTGDYTRPLPVAGINPAAASPGSITGQIPAEARAAEAQNLWKQWFEMATNSWQKATTLGTEATSLAPRWIEMLEQIRHNLFSAEGYPTDPLQFVTRLYNATSGPLSDFVGDIIQREDFLEASNSFMQSYTSFYKVFRRDSEKYLKNLQIPVRSDITRVAGLVVALEDKIDRLEDAFEEFEYGYAEPATAESLEAVEERLDDLERTLERIEGGAEGAATADSVNHLDDRLDAVEAKIDRLLASFESTSQNGSVQTEATQAPPQNSEEATEEIRATAAARRTAKEMGVELS
ncbi:MAG: hypothetical protein JOZ19_00030, partial [Rubrobacter sp.]|nr:hypothetical protein [Rubrobacter sp.]